MKKLRLILGDQLNLQHSWFEKQDDQIWYCLFEMRQETDYVPHHVQKVVGFFMSMRNFAERLEKAGHQVIYYKLDDPNNQQTLPGNLSQLIGHLDIDHFEYQLPDEYRLDEQLKAFCEDISISSEVFDSEHFLTSRTDLATFFEGKKQYLMESFYRMIRRKYDILMDGDQPLTGRWNYDAENRKKLPKTYEIPTPLSFEHDVEEFVALLNDAGVNTIGAIDSNNFIWPVNREEGIQLLDFFLENCLADFGRYQDAMTREYWSIFHSRISFALNTKMLHPLEVVRKSLDYWNDHKESIDIAQIEGFIRQIIGWREYMRGIYWAKMPEYAGLNYFEHQGPLPKWFWTGETKMACLSHAISQSLEFAYAHHIQRLMLTGNFALLAGIHPDEVDEWYLGIYIDAIEWVEITNTRGMSQYADGGIVGTKPYVSSANYIDKMGSYCKDCYYDKKIKTGPRACPFNSLYWHFYDRHRSLLSKNPRIGMAYRTWDRMDSTKKADLLSQAETYLNQLEEL